MRRLTLGILIASIGAITGSTNVNAQSPRATPRYPFEELRDSLLKGVVLTDSQKVKVETIASGYLDLMRANQARMSGAPRDSQRVFVRELRDKQVNDLRRVLTPAQQKKFDQNRIGNNNPPPSTGAAERKM
jgi:hypothetical protein